MSTVLPTPTTRLDVVEPDGEWTKPVPHVDPLSDVYFRAAADGMLLFEKCPRCGHAQHYPRGWCTECGEVPEWAAASGLGTVYSFTVVRQAGMPGFKEEVPFVLALVDIDEGPRIMGNVTTEDVDSVRVGSRVEAYIVRVTPEIGLPQWRLAAN